MRAKKLEGIPTAATSQSSKCSIKKCVGIKRTPRQKINNTRRKMTIKFLLEKNVVVFMCIFVNLVNYIMDNIKCQSISPRLE